MKRIINGLAEMLSPIVGLPVLIFHIWQSTSRSRGEYQSRNRASLNQYQEVLDWVKTQNLLLDTACELPLPQNLVHITQRGSVFVLHTADDRYCILMKTWIFSGRENFRGTFYCDEPLSENDFRNYPYENKNCIRIEGKYNCIDKNGKEDYGPNFKELYVSQNHNDQLFEVYYTLN
ncbi:hypothetical protein [Coleofasciculus sp. E1-EBD-02]|uniref:hypothetical protein n=1 Tax=Coleofasciculus sp. E1-EBD-02 TaxID=3068481 RepID=UPI0032F65519